MVRRIFGLGAITLLFLSIIAFLTQYSFDTNTGIPQDEYPGISFTYFLRVLRDFRVSPTLLIYTRNTLQSFRDIFTAFEGLELVSSWSNFGAWLIDIVSVLLAPVIWLFGILVDLFNIIASIITLLLDLVILA